jgi:small subunit ribosomal protein S25e
MIRRISKRRAFHPQTSNPHIPKTAPWSRTQEQFRWHDAHTVKDKAQHAVILDKATSDRLQKEVQSYRLVTVATLVDRLKINGSLARRSLAELEEQGQIKKVVSHSKCIVYSAFWSSSTSTLDSTNFPTSPCCWWHRLNSIMTTHAFVRMDWGQFFDDDNKKKEKISRRF